MIYIYVKQYVNILFQVASLDVLATVLEEMPPFPEKEVGGLLNLLKKKRPGRVPENPEIKMDGEGSSNNKSSASTVNAISLDNNGGGLGVGGGEKRGEHFEFSN